MKILKMFLMGIALISVGCVESPYITQGNYLAHQGFIELPAEVAGDYFYIETIAITVAIQIPSFPY